MTYEGSVKLIYTCKEKDFTCGSTFPELLPDECVTIESQSYDLNIHQYFELFKKFTRALGFNDLAIMKGACNLAFNDCNSEEDMRRVASEYDLLLLEDKENLFEQYEKQHSEEVLKYKNEIKILKQRLSEYENLSDIESSSEDYDDEENSKIFIRQNQDSGDRMAPWNGLVPGSDISKALGCICPVLDNLEMPENKKWVDVECPIHGRKKND